MKQTRVAKVLVAFVAAVAVLAVVFWGRISEAFGPMRQTESQCLICDRNRVEKWVIESKVQDEVTTNVHSDWIDTFIPLNHDHEWMTHTAYDRWRWFGGKSIACGGIATIPRIFEQRDRLGELDARKLVTAFHALVKDRSSQTGLRELDTFTMAVVDDPESLLKKVSEGPSP